MAQVQVDPAAVERLAEELGGVTSALVEASAVLARTGAAAADDPTLEVALEALAGAWRTGLQRLADEAVATGHALQDGAHGYRRVDAAVAQGCR